MSGPQSAAMASIARQTDLMDRMEFGRRKMMVEKASDFRARLRQAWRRALSKRRAVNELAACPPGELRRIASDVGLSGDDLRQLSCGHVGSSELLLQRLQQLRIDCTACGARDVQRPRACMRVLHGVAALPARFGSRRRPSRDGCLLHERPDHRCPDGARRAHGLIAPEQGGQHALVDDAPRRTTGDSHA